MAAASFEATLQRGDDERGHVASGATLTQDAFGRPVK
jgi:hypothetical protein